MTLGPNNQSDDMSDQEYTTDTIMEDQKGGEATAVDTGTMSGTGIETDEDVLDLNSDDTEE